MLDLQLKHLQGLHVGPNLPLVLYTEINVMAKMSVERTRIQESLLLHLDFAMKT